MTKLIHFSSRQSSFWCVVGDWWILAHFVSFGQVEPGPVAHHVTLDPVPATSDTHLTHPPVWASAAPSGVKIIKKKVFFFTSPFQLVAVFVVTKCLPFSGKCVLCFLWNNLILWFFSGAAAGFLNDYRLIFKRMWSNCTSLGSSLNVLSKVFWVRLDAAKRWTANRPNASR